MYKQLVRVRQKKYRFKLVKRLCFPLLYNQILYYKNRIKNTEESAVLGRDIVSCSLSY